MGLNTRDALLKRDWVRIQQLTDKINNITEKSKEVKNQSHKQGLKMDIAKTQRKRNQIFQRIRMIKAMKR